MIHIWLPTSYSPLRLWQATTQTWQIADNWQEVATMATLQSNKSKSLQACLYFPSINLLKIQPDLTASQLKSLGEAGRRYLFEDISIGSVEDLQVKIQPTTSNSDLPFLLGLHRADIAQWTHAASLAGIEMVAMLPDFSLLPTMAVSTNAHNEAVFYQDNDTQLLKISPSQGMSVSYLPIVLAQLSQAQLPTIDTLYLTGSPTDEVKSQLATVNTIELIDSDLLPQPVKEPTRHFLNFAILKSEATVSPYVKIIAMVAIVALLTTFVVEGLRWYYYGKAQQQAKTLLEQQYHQWFANEKLNPKLNIQRQLASKLTVQSNNQPNVLTTLSAIQPILQQYQLTARQVNFQNNHIQLQLAAPNGEILNKAVNDITNKGIKAKLGAVNPVNTANTNAPTNPQNDPTLTNASTSLAVIEIDL